MIYCNSTISNSLIGSPSVVDLIPNVYASTTAVLPNQTHHSTLENCGVSLSPTNHLRQQNSSVDTTSNCTEIRVGLNARKRKLSQPDRNGSNLSDSITHINVKPEPGNNHLIVISVISIIKI